MEFIFGENVSAEGLSAYEREVLFFQKRKKGKVRLVEAPVLPGPVADTHAHLDMISNAPLALARCAHYGVKFICTIMDVHENSHTTFEMLPTWMNQAAKIYEGHGLGEFARAAPTVRVAIGCHPHNGQHYTDELHEHLSQTLKNPLVCAIGEVGLDFHYDHSPREDQRRAFRKQIQLSHETGLPLILHLREAHDEGFAIMNEEGWPEAGVLLHCYNLDEEVLRPWVEAGCYVAYGGPLTFKSMPEVGQSALTVPLDRLLTETDAPFMTPEPLRGIECGPEFTIFTAAHLLELFDCKTEQQQAALLDTLYQNACSLLNREATPWQLG